MKGDREPVKIPQDWSNMAKSWTLVDKASGSLTITDPVTFYGEKINYSYSRRFTRVFKNFSRL